MFALISQSATAALVTEVSRQIHCCVTHRIEGADRYGLGEPTSGSRLALQLIYTAIQQ